MSIRPHPQDVRRVAVVGTGTIGASWALHFLSRGMTVTATDPAPDAGDRLRRFVEEAAPALRAAGIGAEADPGKLVFTPDLAEAVREADFIQENAPEREEVKAALLADIDRAARPEVVIASSTSGLAMTALQQSCRHPGRCVTGHPFNPPYLIPLVEVVGGQATDPDAVAWALAFYETVGKKAIHVRREVPGHVANRLQAALYREAVHLVAEGVADVADVDAAVAFGPGLRWAIMGPHLIFHLGGGRGGMEGFLAHIGPAVEAWWRDLGHPSLTPELCRRLVDGVAAEASGHTIEELEKRRDDALVRILAVLRESGELPAPEERTA